jgi:hypothetical protein
MGEEQIAPRRNAVGIATLAVACLILVTVVAMLGLQIWRTTQPNASGLAGDLQESMSRYLAQDDSLSKYQPQVGAVTLMRSGENQFEASVEISSGSGKHSQVPVHVNYDGDDMFWSTQPGSFLFLIPTP